MTKSTPIDAPNKPPKEKEIWDDEEEKVADQDKALEEEPKRQKGKCKAASKGIFKAPKGQKTSSTTTKPPSPTTSKKVVEKPKKRKSKVYSINYFFN